MRSMTDEGFVWLDDVTPVKRARLPEPARVVAPDEVAREAKASPRIDGSAALEASRQPHPLREARSTAHEIRWPARLWSLARNALHRRRALVEFCLDLTETLTLTLRRALLVP